MMYQVMSTTQIPDSAIENLEHSLPLRSIWDRCTGTCRPKRISTAPILLIQVNLPSSITNYSDSTGKRILITPTYKIAMEVWSSRNEWENAPA